jgi:outer membrane protein assembly factor BamD
VDLRSLAIARGLLVTLTALLLAAALACAGHPAADSEWAELPPAEDLYAQGLTDLDGGRKLWFLDTTDYESAIGSFQDIIDNYPYSDYAVLAELRIADAYFQQGLYEEALSYYQDFADLHPDNERVPYTIYRAALCHVNRTQDSLRDQTATLQALAQLERLLNEHPFSAEAQEAEVLWKDMRTLLAEQVMDIADFYLKDEEWQSAADRYRSVLNEYPGLGLDAQALYKLGLCYTNMDRDDEATRMFQVILENYRGSDVADAAQELVPAAN